MTLQSSGAISLSDIQTEFGGSNPISLSEYYAGNYVPSGTGSIPSSGAISMNSFYGTSAYTGVYMIIQKFATDYTTERGLGLSNYTISSDYFWQSGYVQNNSSYRYYVQKFDKIGESTMYYNTNIGTDYIESPNGSDIITFGNDNASTSNLYLARVNSSASLLWCIKITWSNSWYQYPTGLYARGYGITALIDGANPNYYGYRSACLLTVNDGGSYSTTTPTLKWAITLSSAGGSRDVDGIALGNDGNYAIAVAGRDASSSDSSLCNATIYGITSTYSGGGALSWARALDYTSVSNARNLKWTGITKAANYYFVVGSYSLGTYGLSNVMFGRYNGSGTLGWHKVLTSASNSNNYYYSHAVAHGGSSPEYTYFVLSTLSNSGPGSTFNQQKVIILKYDAAGTLQWQRTLTPNSSGYTYRLQFNDIRIMENSDRIVLTGSINRSAYTSGYNTVNDTYDTITVKLPVDGSHTGTFSISGVSEYSFTYAASSYTIEAGSFTDIDWSSNTARADASSAVTFTSYTPTLTGIGRSSYRGNF